MERAGPKYKDKVMSLYIEFINGREIIGQVSRETNPKTRDLFWKFAMGDAKGKLVDMNLRSAGFVDQSMKVSEKDAREWVERYGKNN